MLAQILIAFDFAYVQYFVRTNVLHNLRTRNIYFDKSSQNICYATISITIDAHLHELKLSLHFMGVYFHFSKIPTSYKVWNVSHLKGIHRKWVRCEYKMFERAHTQHVIWTNRTQYCESKRITKLDKNQYFDVCDVNAKHPKGAQGAVWKAFSWYFWKVEENFKICFRFLAIVSILNSSLMTEETKIKFNTEIMRESVYSLSLSYGSLIYMFKREPRALSF